MITIQFLHESAAKELAKKLPSLEKYDYDIIDKLMRGIAKKHHITGKALHDLFVKKFHRTPDDWVKGKLDEASDEPSEAVSDNSIHSEASSKPKDICAARLRSRARRSTTRPRCRTRSAPRR